MSDRLHLLPRHRRLLEALLRRYLPDVEVWAYGSRVNGRSHDGSDLDLVLRGPGLEQIPIDQLVDFEEAVRESNIPFLVEARDWTRLPKRFHREIERDYVSLGTPAGRSLDGKSCWPGVQLGVVAELLTGFPFKSEQYTDDRHAPRLLRGDNVAQGTLRWSGAKRWAANATTIDTGYWLEEGDVVLAMDRPWIEAGLKYASVRRDDLPALLVQRVARLRGGERLHTRFLHYVIGSRDFTQYVTSVQTGTAVPHISARQIKDFAFCLPPLSEQCAIANILGTLDDKIELNRRTNETLEAMARALFKSWFVDFEPVRAKMEGRDTGLPQDISTLFPAKITEVISGDVPVGWHPYQLADLAEHHTATTSPGAMPDAVFGHFSIPAYDSGQKPIPELGADIKSNKTLVPHGAVLLSKLNPDIPRVWLPSQSLDVPRICSTEFLVFTPLAPASRSLLFSLFCDNAFRTMLRSLVTGTSKSHQRVPPRALKSQFVVTGTPAVFRAFHKLATPWLDRTISNRAESQMLAKVRDALLPRLVSGEVRVQQVEQVLGNVL